jgi:hypothetical protein
MFQSKWTVALSWENKIIERGILFGPTLDIAPIKDGNPIMHYGKS